MYSWIMSAWVCISFVTFVTVWMMSASKRLVAWFDRQKALSHPPSVTQTLNILNFESDDKAESKARNVRNTIGG